MSILCCWEGVLYVFCESVFKVSFSFVCLFVFCFLLSGLCLFDVLFDFLPSTVFFCFLLYFFLLCLLLACLCVWVVFFCFLQFSLPITKYFVLLITGFFFCLLALSFFAQQSVFFTSSFCECLFFCGWCLFLWPLLMLLRSLLVCVGVIFYSFSLKYLDQRVGFLVFSLLFNVFCLLRVQEFKSFCFLLFCFVLIFPPSTLSLYVTFVLIYLAVYFH